MVVDWECDKMVKLDSPFNMPLDQVKEWRFKVFKQIFEFHYKNCPLYTRYCDLYHVTPEDIKTNSDLNKIQPVPSDAFRDMDSPIISVPEADIVFKSTTSSTTSSKPVWFCMDKTSIDRTNFANRRSFTEILKLRDGFVFFLTPKDSDTGLVKGMQATLRTIGLPPENSDYLVTGGEFDVEQVIKKLTDCPIKPRHIYGPPFVFMRIVEYMEANNKQLKLDPESRLMTTGGWKRVQGEVPREMFIERVSKVFGVDGSQIRDSLGLTDIFTMLPECEHHKKHVPPWFYISARNPEKTNEEVAEGETGLLVYMSSLIQSYPAFCMTGDMGVLREGVCECGRTGQTVQHMGRAQGAGARGCAIRLEEFMNKIQK